MIFLVHFVVFIYSGQVFQVRKINGTDSGKIFAMKVLKKVSFNMILCWKLLNK